MASGLWGLELIWTAVGAERAKALPASYAFTGADNTGRFSCIGEAIWPQVYMKDWKTDMQSVICRCFQQRLKWPNPRWPLWLALSVQPTRPKASTLRASLNCGGIFSASIWQKVTSYLLLKLWNNMSWESISKPEFGDRPALHCRILSWIPGEWLPHGVRWPAETNHDRRPSSSTGHHWDG